MDITGYCVKCKEKGVTLSNAKIHETKNGRYMAKGTHTCGTTVCAIMNKDKAMAAVNEGLELVKEKDVSGDTSGETITPQ